MSISAATSSLVQNLEREERAGLYTALKELESLKGRVASSGDNLQNALLLYDKVQVLFYRHYAYLYLRNAVNTQ